MFMRYNGGAPGHEGMLSSDQPLAMENDIEAEDAMIIEHEDLATGTSQPRQGGGPEAADVDEIDSDKGSGNEAEQSEEEIDTSDDGMDFDFGPNDGEDSENDDMYDNL